MQSKLGSFIEAMINILIGFVINFVANLIILPYYGFTTLDAATNFKIGVAFTVISVVRLYVLRRYFNHRIHIAASKLAGNGDTT
jgi:hypothetical protein